MLKKNLSKLIQYKCPYCGAFLPKYPFYDLNRYIGTYKVWICPKCKSKISMWHKK